MSSVERFIRYIKIDTQSDPKHSDVVPSTQKQFDLAKVLYEELKEMGLSDVRLDEHCYVYGKLPSNLDHPAKREDSSLRLLEAVKDASTCVKAVSMVPSSMVISMCLSKNPSIA